MSAASLAASPARLAVGEKNAACFDRALRRVHASLAAAAEADDPDARDAIALAIFEDVTRFVLDWQEGP